MKFKYFAEKIVPIVTAIVLVTFFIVMAVKYNKIVLPGAVIGSLASLYVFYEVNRVKHAKREDRREYMNERRQEILDNAIKKKKNTQAKND